LNQVRARLNSSLAQALDAQEKLNQALEQNRVEQERLDQELSTMSARVDALDREVNRLDSDIKLTTARIEVEKQQVRRVARVIYMQPDSVVVQLAGSRDLGDFVTTISDMAAAGSRAKALKEHLAVDERRLQTERKKQAADLEEQLSLRSQVEFKLQRIQRLEAQQQAAVQDLGARMEQTKAELAQATTQSAAVANQITYLLQQQQQAVIAAAMQPVWDQLRTIRMPDTFPSTGSHSKLSRFIWPLPDAEITQGFGPSPYWFEPPYQGYAHFHTGLDLASPEGTPVLSADDGVVVLVGGTWVNGVLVGYGNYVIVAHAGGVDTMYAHLDEALVRPGDPVFQGQPIGREGSTGNSTGPHLHFEARVNGAMVDPAAFLPAGGPSSSRA
jgi:murein DD-endopeptidase MepM/ murein hydrolase activator NlpD